MAINLYTASYGLANANAQVLITEVGTGLPAIVLATSTGGEKSSRGQATLDSSGNLSVYIDTARSWNVLLISSNPAGLKNPSPIPTTLTSFKGQQLLDPPVGSKFGCLPLAYQSGVASSVTGTVTETTLGTLTLPGSILGPNGLVKIETLWTHTNSVNNKTLKSKLGGQAIQNMVVTTTATTRAMNSVANRQSYTSQACFNPATVSSYGSGTAATSTFTVNTAVDTVINFTGTLANTGETITLEAWQVVVWPKAY